MPVQMYKNSENLLWSFYFAGFVSYREESEGTWFIKALSLTFMRDAHECHIDRLLQIVKIIAFVFWKMKLLSFFDKSRWMNKFDIGQEQKMASRL